MVAADSSFICLQMESAALSRAVTTGEDEWLGPRMEWHGAGDGGHLATTRQTARLQANGCEMPEKWRKYAVTGWCVVMAEMNEGSGGVSRRTKPCLEGQGDDCSRYTRVAFWIYKKWKFWLDLIWVWQRRHMELWPVNYNRSWEMITVVYWKESCWSMRWSENGSWVRMEVQLVVVNNTDRQKKEEAGFGVAATEPKPGSSIFVSEAGRTAENWRRRDKGQCSDNKRLRLLFGTYDLQCLNCNSSAVKTATASKLSCHFSNTFCNFAQNPFSEACSSLPACIRNSTASQPPQPKPSLCLILTISACNIHQLQLTSAASSHHTASGIAFISLHIATALTAVLTLEHHRPPTPPSVLHSSSSLPKLFFCSAANCQLK
ncbi:hypothetical protein C5167_038996 [Papaver somniferum]|uniref:Uncharacterized protein n=1 Tax=Papaver somniferum TaxID=3469 RepID=A0A4Y7IF59_PAPSO|nr:hypothetical protein C5167_038996 [Papaver somniferum]